MARPFGEDFPEVLAAARAGGGWAFERLYTWLAADVAAYARGSGADDPEGTTNEVFLRAFRALGDFQGTEDRFRSWVFAIAHNRLVDERRRQGRRAAEVPLDRHAERGPAVADAAESALASLGDEQVRRLLDRLSEDQRTVLLLRVVADLSIEDTASAMGRRPGAVKALQHRAIRSLRAVLSEGVSP